MSTERRILDFHSHWGTERGWKGSPYETAEARGALKDYFKWEMAFVDEDEQADRFRRAGARVMLDLAYTATMDAGVLRAQHDYAFDVSRRYPDAILGHWIGIDPTRPDHVAELERCLRDGPGLIGLTVQPYTPAGPADGPAWEPCLRLCAEANRPILVHTGMSATGAGTRGGMGIELEGCHPRYVDRVAARHPDLNVIAARVSWPWQPEMIATALHKANVWLELHGWAPKHYPAELQYEIRRRLRNKVLFGADYPMLGHERLIGEWREQGYPDDVLDDVFHDNGERLLALMEVR